MDNQNPKLTPQEWAAIREIIQAERARRLALRSAGYRKEYIAHEPFPKQLDFFNLECLEGFYGGAAAGGKSDALLMRALKYVDRPDYCALLLRRSYADLNLPGAIMDRSKEWLSGTDAKWNERDKQWRFPSGATLTFGYLEHENDKYRYQGSEFHFIGFDELTQFTETQYTYMFSRLRKRAGCDIPLFMGSASNPGGVGHEWVLQRMLLGQSEDRVFIPSKVLDNPFVDGSYVASLAHLDDATRLQLLEGDWAVRPKGPLFEPDHFRIIGYNELPPAPMLWVRAYDLATSVRQTGHWTAGALVGIDIYQNLYIKDMVRVKKEFPDVRNLIVDTAHRDGDKVTIGIEDKHTGLAMVQELFQHPDMMPFPVIPVPVVGDKMERASAWATRARTSPIRLVRGEWNSAFTSECIAFDGTETTPNDQVDAVSVAFAMLQGVCAPKLPRPPLDNRSNAYFVELGRRARMQG